MAAPTTTMSPTLCRANAQWWSRAYGRRSGSAQPVEAAAAIDGFYLAIRDNRVELVQRFLADHPAAVFTKIFGNNQRTALYVASFFGRHQIVRLLLHRGADKDLLCEGVRPIDVAGFASADSVDCMKVRSFLQDDACPQVILELDSRPSIGAAAAGAAHRFRLKIHFSEAVDEFTLEDVVTSEGCAVTGFSMLRRDLYVATVQLVRGIASASVEVPAGAARAVVGGRCSAGSRPLELSAQASLPH